MIHFGVQARGAANNWLGKLRIHSTVMSTSSVSSQDTIKRCSLSCILVSPNDFNRDFHAVFSFDLQYNRAQEVIY